MSWFGDLFAPRIVRAAKASLAKQLDEALADVDVALQAVLGCYKAAQDYCAENEFFEDWLAIAGMIGELERTRTLLGRMAHSKLGFAAIVVKGNTIVEYPRSVGSTLLYDFTRDYYGIKAFKFCRALTEPISRCQKTFAEISAQLSYCKMRPQTEYAIQQSRLQGIKALASQARATAGEAEMILSLHIDD